MNSPEGATGLNESFYIIQYTILYNIIAHYCICLHIITHYTPQLAIRNTLGGPDTQILIFWDSENGFPR